VAAMTRASTSISVSPPGGETSLLQSAQDLSLLRQRQIADLVEEERSVLPRSHAPLASRDHREGAFQMANSWLSTRSREMAAQ